MSTGTLKKASARLGGLTAALAMMGAIGIGGASAAEAHGECANKSNPHINCSSTPKSDAEYEGAKTMLQCAAATGGATAVGTPAAGAVTAGTCLFGSL